MVRFYFRLSSLIISVVLEHISVVYPTLKEIRLGMCNITHTSLKTLTSYCPQITTLDLRLCRHIKHFDSIANLKQLKDLNLSGTSVGDHDIELITTGCSTLSALYLVECHQITHAVPSIITENAIALQHLDLAGSVSVVGECGGPAATADASRAAARWMAMARSQDPLAPASIVAK